MTVKQLKKLLKGMPEDRDILLACWINGRTVLRYTNRCCNVEHQEKNNELWLSTEGTVKRA